MIADNAADDAGLVGRDRVLTVVSGMIRAALLGGWTYETLGEATKLAPRRIKGYCVEGKEPPLSAALSIAAVLGRTKGVNPIMSLIGYVGEPLDESHLRKAGEVIAEVAKDFAVLASAARNGRFDHTTEPQVREACDLIIEELVPLSSVGRAA